MSRPLSTSILRALRHPRWGHEEARIVLDAVAASGLTLAQFAREYEVDYQRLNAWRRRLAAPTTTAPPIEFVELRVPALMPTTTPRYEIQLPGGEILRVDGAVDTTVVGALVALLRGARSC